MRHIFLCSLLLCLSGCVVRDSEKAGMLLSEARVLVMGGEWRSARILLDSLHAEYPGEVAHRRMAKSLEDSIEYLEAQKSLLYADSLLPILESRVDMVLKDFVYEKEEVYEDAGRYVHRLLRTGSNPSRNFLQAYVRDDGVTIVKSYYYGSVLMNQRLLCLTSNKEEVLFSGSNHAFSLDGWHEIMTLEDASALQLLNFVSAHMDARIRVKGEGDKEHKTWVYYLNDKEKLSLSKTYELGWLMKDLARAEDMRNQSHRRIMRYEAAREGR